MENADHGKRDHGNAEPDAKGCSDDAGRQGALRRRDACIDWPGAMIGTAAGASCTCRLCAADAAGRRFAA
ncbi:MAG TPA: hypothetical protein VGC09_20635 [Rhodopila sp.]